MKREKVEYFENEKSFKDEIKGIFHNFYKVFIESNKTAFFEYESLTLTV